MDEDIKNRIRVLIDTHHDGNLSKFARLIDLNPSDVQVMLSSKKRGVPASFFKALPKCGANLNWIVTGKADLLRHNKKLKDFEKIQDELEHAEYYIDKLENLIKVISSTLSN